MQRFDIYNANDIRYWQCTVGNHGASE